MLSFDYLELSYSASRSDEVGGSVVQDPSKSWVDPGEELRPFQKKGFDALPSVESIDVVGLKFIEAGLVERDEDDVAVEIVVVCSAFAVSGDSGQVVRAPISLEDFPRHVSGAFAGPMCRDRDREIVLETVAEFRGCHHPRIWVVPINWNPRTWGESGN